MVENKSYKSVDEYISSQPEEIGKVLTVLRSYILEAAPYATELINYSIPAFSLIEGGKRDQQIMIAGYRNHVGLYPHPTVLEHFDDELCDYKRSKGAVQFPINSPLPKDLIIKMIKYRMDQLKETRL